ncbi:MAG: hypothetical protein HYY06_32960 [Deltaproteobacteria bacterium]|nr:hypothetical protein [Deltaproteobacteria bacterium]
MKRAVILCLLVMGFAACDDDTQMPTPPPDVTDTGGSPLGCVDHDGDGYGLGCEPGADCDEGDGVVHDGCAMTCAFPHAGCGGCDPGAAVDCHILPDGARQCVSGRLTCGDDGVFGECELDQADLPEGAHEYSIIQGDPVTCGNCDPGCWGAEDVFDDDDLTPENSNGLEFNPNACWDENGDGDTNDAGECGALTIGGSTVTARYAWIANSPDSTVSKLNLTTGAEVGRYYVGLPNKRCSCWCNGCNNPSRTAVDGYGNAYVANRAFGGQGTVVKIGADPYYCIDRNRNGVIDTSTNSVPMAWGTDECVLWTLNVGGNDAVPRALAIDAGDANVPEGYVWVGTYNARRAYRINPRDGSYYCFQRAGNGNCIRDYVDLGMYPYGATGDRRGWVWFTAWGTTDHLIAVEGSTGNVIHRGRSDHPSCGSDNTYGIAVDRWGQIWTGGWECGIFRYNVGDAARWGDETWCYVEPIRRCSNGDPNFARACTKDAECGAGNTCSRGAGPSRGVAADCEGNIWTAYSQSPSALQYLRDDAVCGAGNLIPRTSTRAVEMRRPNGMMSGEQSIGVGVDFEGRIWTVNQASSNVSVFNPTLWRTQTYATGPNPYTYSDFTGYQRQNFVNPSGWYRHTYDTRETCGVGQRAQFDVLSWDARMPANTELIFEAYVGDSPTDLSTDPILLARTPPDAPPVYISDILADAGYPNPLVMSLVVTLRSLDGTATPLFRSVYVEFYCMDLE